MVVPLFSIFGKKIGIKEKKIEMFESDEDLHISFEIEGHVL